MDDLEEMAQRVFMISNGKIAYDGNFDGLRDITGSLTRITVTIDGGNALTLDGGKLISVANGIYEFEVDVTRNPIKHLLRQLSDADGVKDVEISKAPIEQVIAGLYAAWK
jgi:ABC-2 type transport system ATP-binding protein